jgi:hypothetical protein
MPFSFQGLGRALSSAGLAAVSAMLGTHAAELFTVLTVETKGCGFLPDRRPQILFERHVFHRLTRGAFDDGDISDPKPGGYGAPGAQQYDRLANAIAKDRAAALQSASWGIGQIMGENFREAGFADVETMVNAMIVGEDEQLGAMGNFLLHAGLHIPLRTHDWASFARGYNGPDFALNRYDQLLSAEFQRLNATSLPDLIVREAQLYLTYLGFDTHGIDGIAGTETLSALAAFQTKYGCGITTWLNTQAVEQLEAAMPGLGVAAG